jgi:hypothetical protein
MLKKMFIRVGIPAIGLGAAGSALAVAPTTVGELASSVSFTDVGGAILAVAGVVITLYVVWKGAKFVLRAVKGA